MVDNYNFNVVPNDEQEEFKVEFGEVFKVVETDFNKLQNRPSYAGTTMTGDTNIPEVPTAVSQLTNDADYQTWAEVNSAIGVEAKARGDADDALQTAIGAVDGKVADEKTAREQADGVLQNNIEAEQTARQNADIGLQGQIDAITSASDVVDIVGTYAELQQYPTSGIKDNDVIKVLQDETHNNAMSYYRWSTSTSTWSYIGSEGPYYTKSESDTLLLAKQNKLTAGDNITITNDVISATDTNTTYTAGNAITIDSTDNNRIDAAIYPADFFTADATASGTGSSITLNDTIPVKLDDVKLDGDTNQQTYSGKNIIDFSTISFEAINGGSGTRDGSTYTVNGANDTRWGGILFNQSQLQLEPNTTYTFSATVQSTTNPDGAVVYISKNMNTTGGYILGNTAQAGEKSVATFTTPDPLPSTSADIRLLPGATSTSAVFTDIQLEKGSTATSYEPYVGGTASPNPNYPQSVQVVTGTQTVNVGGKNLIYGSDQTNGGIQSIWSNSNVTLSGTTTTNYANITAVYSDVSFPAGDYTFSMTHSTNQFRIKIRFRYDGSNHDYAIAKGASSVTFSLPKEAELVLLYIDDFSAGAQLSESFGIQLEQGSTPTSYQLGPQIYTVDLGSIELCKIGDYQDYIYKNGDDWYVHKAIGKNTLNISTITAYTGYTNIDYALIDKPTDYIKYDTFQYEPVDFTHALCFLTPEGGSSGYDSANNIGKAYFGGSRAKFRVGFAKGTTLSVMQSTFTGAILYYPLATPTDTKITDNTLIGQLNALYGAQGYDDKTILTVSATGTNLPAILEVSAYAKSLEGIIDNAFIDTTYNDFTGTDGNTDGKSGLVPAPTTTDAGKFLKADGTWDTAGSSVTPVQTIGTSTTDVMSQDATTKMVFENASEGRIKIGNGASTHSGGAVAIGRSATASGTNAVAVSAILGTASGTSSVVIGRDGTANKQGAIAIGYAARAQGNGSIAIGGYSGDNDSAFIKSNKHGGIALGMGSYVEEVGEMNIGDRSSTYGYNSSAYRLLSGVYDGQNAHDAATVGQINATIDAINTALNTNIPHIGANN